MEVVVEVGAGVVFEIVVGVEVVVQQQSRAPPSQ